MLINDLKQKKIAPKDANATLSTLGTSTLNERTSFARLLKRPQVNVYDLASFGTDIADYLAKYDPEILEQAEILLKYEDYIQKEQQMAEKIANLESLHIKENFDFNEITALSAEAKEKLEKIRPKTIGQASRISGVSPADISILMVYMGR